jgi:hypothetical protein
MSFFAGLLDFAKRLGTGMNTRFSGDCAFRALAR